LLESGRVDTVLALGGESQTVHDYVGVWSSVSLPKAFFIQRDSSSERGMTKHQRIRAIAILAPTGT
jgi:hypothetical protein